MKRNVKITLLFFFLILAALSIYQLVVLQIAHSSFDNYYRFRDCVQLINKTNDYGTCVISSGEVIKIVKYQDKWYLDGDLPGTGIF